jgi:hypothetical protein
MAARESAALQHARELITTGRRSNRKTPTEAAKIAGCERQTIYKSRWYKEYKSAEAERIASGAGGDE